MNKIFNKIVNDLSNYLTSNNIRSMVLGISGGIDSTLCSIICREVSEKTGIKFIGRSLPFKNKSDEFTLSLEVGNTFCANFKVTFLDWALTGFILSLLEEESGEQQFPEDRYYTNIFKKINNQTPIANGNIQARLRMIYLYNLASLNKGLVIGTDNKTEWNLGFWTLHGDVGDIYPILDLWKTDVYNLSRWCLDNICRNDREKEVLQKSINIIPTDGLGISDSDLDQIGASSYEQVDYILKQILRGFEDSIVGGVTKETIEKIKERHEKSKFKRIAKPLKINL